MKDLQNHQRSLSGTLLAAHPGLLDPNFHEAVVLLSAHSAQEGAIGVVINRPMSQTLADVKDDFEASALGDVPLFYGGPVNKDEVILAAWKWEPDGGIFRLYFGLTEEKAEDLLAEDPDIDIRGFLGYAGWSEGQLEGELTQDAWVLCPIDGEALRDLEQRALWKRLLTRTKPELIILTDAPDDPSVN